MNERVLMDIFKWRELVRELSNGVITVADKGNEMQIKMHRKENIYVEKKINASKRKYLRRK